MTLQKAQRACGIVQMECLIFVGSAPSGAACVSSTARVGFLLMTFPCA